jgi:hypothetical protein
MLTNQQVSPTGDNEPYFFQAADLLDSFPVALLAGQATASVDGVGVGP